MATAVDRHPEFKKDIGRQSPRGKKRLVPMECLCLGFPRTGTSSMFTALEVLGLKCWHSTLFLSSNWGDVEMFQEAVDRKWYGAHGGQPFTRDEWDQLLHEFGAVSSDPPAMAFAEDLIAAYPEAKVVLVERDIDAWFTSMMETVILQMYHPINNLVSFFDPWYLGPIGKIQHDTLGGYMNIHNPDEARLRLKDAYRAHYARLREILPKDRLLEFKLADGWGPLCEFLDKPVPDVPFPHVNENKFLGEKINLAIKRSILGLVSRTAPYGAALGVAVFAAWWWRST